MDKKILESEKQYLDKVLENISIIKQSDSKKIKLNQESIKSLKQYFAENFYDINKAAKTEIGQINLQIENLENQNDTLQIKIKRLEKQQQTPYFGRFDFATNFTNPSSFYIGLGHVSDANGNNLVYDWRSDICSLYYDDEIGKTSYACPQGEIEGELSLKRQFKIENGKLLYYIDNHMLIDDEILMQELSKNASLKMQNIVSTIQKEQNTLIRSDDFENTIVQGVAGSGKTSIAMHRVSYLLYKYRNKLKSNDILVLSPTEIFTDYLSDIFPALGEEKPYTTTFSEMAHRLLGEEFETREAMLDKVISFGKQKDFENIAIKSSFEFAYDLNNFIKTQACNLFLPKNLVFGEVAVSKEELSDIFFNRLGGLPIYKRVEVIAEYIAEKFNVTKDEHEQLVARAKQIVYSKFLTTDILKIYNLFLGSVGLEEISTIGNYDVAPMLLIKQNLFSLKNTFDAKYVIVDEMQDYTPCHFMLFNKIFDCSKLYLGDIYQSIDRTLTESYLKNLAALTKGKIKYLNKSYRSTLQISMFAQKILGKHIAENVNRNGADVECIKTDDCAKAIEEILSTLKGGSVAIICKTQKEIKLLTSKSAIIKKFKKLDDGKLESKNVITTPAQAKGVEFDNVIIPFANSCNYSNQLERNLLYVSATRALHKLYFVSDKTPSKFLIKK